jgi:hypothetical protein
MAELFAIASICLLAAGMWIDYAVDRFVDERRRASEDKDE